jgi:hypothetical protein
LPESITLLLEVSTRALRVALLRYAGLDTPLHARFAAVRPDSKPTNGMVFCPLDLLSTSVYWLLYKRTQYSIVCCFWNGAIFGPARFLRH